MAEARKQFRHIMYEKFPSIGEASTEKQRIIDKL